MPQPYSGIATFGRQPHTRDLTGVDVAIVGVPYDGATSYRSGARFGPRAIREQSLLLWGYNNVLGVAPFEMLRVIDYGDVEVVPDLQAAHAAAKGIALEKAARETIGKMRAALKPPMLIEVENLTEPGWAWFPTTSSMLFEMMIAIGMVTTMLWEVVALQRAGPGADPRYPFGVRPVDRRELPFRTGSGPVEWAGSPAAVSGDHPAGGGRLGGRRGSRQHLRSPRDPDAGDADRAQRRGPLAGLLPARVADAARGERASRPARARRPARLPRLRLPKRPERGVRRTGSHGDLGRAGHRGVRQRRGRPRDG